jgi:hypothetical protein
MHHHSIAYLLTLVLFQEQVLHGTAQAITSSLDDAEQGSTPDLQMLSAACHLEKLSLLTLVGLKPKSVNLHVNALASAQVCP